MLKNRNINVCLVSDLFENYPLSENTIVVVVDLLRATTDCLPFFIKIL